ncbi:hypothetical protein ES703_117724 [subsurface metagenome]
MDINSGNPGRPVATTKSGQGVLDARIWGRNRSMNKILKKLKVKKISFCVNSNPSTGLEFLVSKSVDGEDIAEVIEAVNNYLEDELTALELAKVIDKDKFLGAISLLKRYRSDMPDDVQAAVDQLVKFAARSYGYGKYPEKEKIDEGEIKKSVPSWDSFRMPGEPTELRIEMADEEKEEEGIQDYDDPFMHQLLKINQRLSSLEKSDQVKDKWKSFEIVAGHFISSERLAKMLPEETIEERPIKKEERSRGEKRGIESTGRHDLEVEVDKWSSWIL